MGREATVVVLKRLGGKLVSLTVGDVRGGVNKGWQASENQWRAFFELLPRLEILDVRASTCDPHRYPYILPMSLRRLSYSARYVSESLPLLQALADQAYLPDLEEAPSTTLSEDEVEGNLYTTIFNDAQATEIFSGAGTWLEIRGLAASDADKAGWNKGAEYYRKRLEALE